MTTFVSFKNIKDELTVFLRNQDVLSISTRGVTTSTELFSGDGLALTVTLSHTTLKNVRSVSVNSSPLAFGRDYSVNYATAVITFAIAPGAGVDNISVVYDWGTTDRVYPDFPQPYLKKSQFPRVGFDIISGSIQEMELGAGSNMTTYRMQVNAYDIDKDNVEVLLNSIKQKIQSNKKLFYYMPFITPISIGPLLVSPFGDDKIFQRSIDLEIKFVWDLL